MDEEERGEERRGERRGWKRERDICKLLAPVMDVRIWGPPGAITLIPPHCNFRRGMKWSIMHHPCLIPQSASAWTNQVAPRPGRETLFHPPCCVTVQIDRNRQLSGYTIIQAHRRDALLLKPDLVKKGAQKGERGGTS